MHACSQCMHAGTIVGYIAIHNCVAVHTHIGCPYAYRTILCPIPYGMSHTCMGQHMHMGQNRAIKSCAFWLLSLFTSTFSGWLGGCSSDMAFLFNWFKCVVSVVSMHVENHTLISLHNPYIQFLSMMCSHPNHSLKMTKLIIPAFCCLNCKGIWGD